MPIATAKDSFVGPNRRVIVKGERLDASDPIIKGREALFIIDGAETPEKATAAPGEKRSTTRATKS